MNFWTWILIEVISKLAATSASENWIISLTWPFLKNIFDTKKILDVKSFIFYFLNPVNHIEFFSAISKSDMELGCVLLNINPIPIRGFFFQLLFDCPTANFGSLSRHGITHPMLSTAFERFQHKNHREPRNDQPKPSQYECFI